MSPVLEPVAGTSEIASIGPVPLGFWHEPSAVEIAGNPGALGGQPIAATFVLRSLVEVRQVLELVNNDMRRRRIGDSFGVLEWVEGTGTLAPWRGFWVLEQAKTTVAARQQRRPDDVAYAPIAINATFFGAAQPVIAATHRELVDDVADLDGVALLAPLHPSLRVEAAGNLVTRAGDGLSLELRKGSDKRAAVRMDAAKFDPTLSQLRPALRDAGGIVHFGPCFLGDAAMCRLQSPFVRLTFGASPAGHWIFEGWVDGAWTTLGAVRVRRTAAAAAHEWNVARAEYTDDGVSVVLVNDYDASDVRVTLLQGELGVRILVGAYHEIQWLNADDSAAPEPTSVGQGLKDTAVLASGARRMIVSGDIDAYVAADFIMQADAGRTALVGYVPADPQADDTAEEQAKQVLFDRDEVLTLE